MFRVIFHYNPRNGSLDRDEKIVPFRKQVTFIYTDRKKRAQFMDNTQNA